MDSLQDIGTSALTRVIRDLKTKNDSLLRLLSAETARIKDLQKRNSALRSAVGDFNAAFMEWMPRLRRTDNEMSRSVADAMRKLKVAVEEKING